MASAVAAVGVVAIATTDTRARGCPPISDIVEHAAAAATTAASAPHTHRHARRHRHHHDCALTCVRNVAISRLNASEHAGDGTRLLNTYVIIHTMAGTRGCRVTDIVLRAGGTFDMLVSACMMEICACRCSPPHVSHDGARQ